MNERDAFLSTIIAAPADDLPRIIFADWLDEHGEGERAEFVRVQCRFAVMDRMEFWSRCGTVVNTCHDTSCTMDAEHREYATLRRREQELLHRIGTEAVFWSLQQRFGGDGGSWTYTRGFISHVKCSWEEWQENADAIRSATPLERVALTTWPQITGVDPKAWCEATWPGVTFTMPSAWQQAAEVVTRFGEVATAGDPL